MRTVTFADPKLIERFNREVVLCELGWFDPVKNPALPARVQYPEVGSPIPWDDHPALTPVWRGNGHGVGTVYLVYATPDGTVLTALSGAWEAKVVLAELDWVQELWGKLKKTPRRTWGQAVRAAHRARAEHWKQAPLTEKERTPWQNSRGLLVATHLLHAQHNPPSMQRYWEASRTRTTINSAYYPRLSSERFPRGDLGRFYQVLGGL